MSIDTAISRIQQIVIMQQQLLDPGAAASAANAAPATSAASTGGTGASFASALASAQGATATGLGSAIGSTPGATTGATIGAAGLSAAGAPMAVQTMLQKAQSLVGRPYVWGGGHSTSDWQNAAGYDCSGFVSAVLGSAGVISSPQSTQTLPSQPGLAAGPGQYVTIYDRDTSADPGQDHVIIDINGTWFESGGNSADNPSGGVAQINPPSQAYLSTFNQLLHPVGM